MKLKTIITLSFILIILLAGIRFYIQWNYGTLYWVNNFGHRFDSVAECMDSTTLSCNPIENPQIDLIATFIYLLVYIIFEAIIIIGIYFIYKETRRFNEGRK